MIHILTTLVLAVAGEGDAKSAPSLRVELSETAQVQGVRFTLGEVVRIECSDLERLARAKEIAVGYTPNPGYERKLRREAIAELLYGAGFARSEVRIYGQPVVAVTTQAATIAPATLLKTGEQFLYDYLAEMGLRDFQIVAKNSPAALIVPAGKEGVKVEADWRGEKRSAGQASLDLRILVDGESYSVVPMSFAIKHFGVAAAAARYIAVGEKLTPENVEFRRMELPVAPVEAVISLDQLSGRESVRAIRPGAVIATADLRAVPVVLKDQPVGVVLRSGGLSLRMRGIAKADGMLGATIGVENPDSGKILYGRVVAPGQVEIPMPGSR